MTQVIQAIFEDAVLKALEQLQLNDRTQVRLTVESVDPRESSDTPTGTNTDPLLGLQVATGIADLAERFDDYRFSRQSP